MDMKKTFPKTSILDTMQLLTSGSSEVSEATIKVGISEKLAEEAINDWDDPFKDLAAEELEETINGFCERLSDEVPEVLNAAVLFDIDAELSTNGDKASDAEIVSEVRGKAIQEDDIDVVYDEPPVPPSAFEVENAIELLQQFTLFCNKGEDLREVLSKVNT